MWGNMRLIDGTSKGIFIKYTLFPTYVNLAASFRHTGAPPSVFTAFHGYSIKRVRLHKCAAGAVGHSGPLLAFAKPGFVLNKFFIFRPCQVSCSSQNDFIDRLADNHVKLHMFRHVRGEIYQHQNRATREIPNQKITD